MRDATRILADLAEEILGRVFIMRS